MWPSNRTLAHISRPDSLNSFVKEGLGRPLYPTARMAESDYLISTLGGTELDEGTPADYCAHHCKYRLSECDAFRVKSSVGNFKCYFYKHACIEFGTEKRGLMYPNGLEDQGVYAYYSFYQLKANDR